MMTVCTTVYACHASGAVNTYVLCASVLCFISLSMSLFISLKLSDVCSTVYAACHASGDVNTYVLCGRVLCLYISNGVVER